jgi:hypothetical protein
MILRFATSLSDLRSIAKSPIKMSGFQHFYSHASFSTRRQETNDTNSFVEELNSPLTHQIR